VSDPPPKAASGIARERVRPLAFERLPRETLDAFAALADLTGTVSDALDLLGLAGAIPASELAPNLPDRRIAGQALTVRNVERQQSTFRSAGEKINRMGESEAYRLAERGDVIVIEGLTGMSNMGGQSATLAHREGCAGAIIEGSYRDPDASRGLGFPIWARGVTPITGKWRLETVEVNGRVRIAGVSVEAGDLVVADEAGVVFVPLAHVPEVLAECRRLDAGDARRKRDIAEGADIAKLNQTRYK
jgi:regulator of RNase E activity RraA